MSFTSGYSSKAFSSAWVKLDLLNNYEIDEDNMVLYTECGLYMPIIANKLVKEGYDLFTWAGGLPGEVGGSICGNAEAYKESISDKLIDVKVLIGNEVKTLKKEDIRFGYRTSEFKENKNAVILSARFKLEKGNTEEMLEKMKERAQRRLSTQPLEYPSAGSTFRNPNIKDYKEVFEKYNIPANAEGFVSAGYLIEQSGLKGIKIGGAMVSEKHANFIINVDNATSKDVIDLINLVRTKVKEKYEIDLILEQEIIDFDK